MIEVMDRTKSTRLRRVPGPTDIAGLQRQRDAVEKQIADIDLLLDAKNSPYFKPVVVDAYLQMKVVERQYISTPLTGTPESLVEHAELRGRWLQLLDVTTSVLSLETTRSSKLDLLRRIVERLTKWVDSDSTKGHT